MLKREGEATMIDAATQILSTMKSGDNSAERTSINKKSNTDSGTSFTSYYDKSRSEISDKPNNQSTSNSSKTSVSERTNDQNKTNKQAVSNVDERRINKTEKNVKNDEIEKNKNLENQTEENSEVEEVITVNSDVASAEIIEEELLSENDPLILLNENVTEFEADETDIEIKASDEGQNQTENKEKLDVISQSIISEIKASIENVDSVQQREKPVELTRSQILENIKNLLDKDLLNEKNIPEQLLKPDLALNINASKVLGEQLKIRDFNIGNNVDMDLKPKIELIPEGEEIPEVDDSTDVLLQKLIEKLEFSKVKSENSNKLANIIADKTSIAEFVDQLSPKSNNESAGGSLFSQAIGLANKAGTASPVQLFTMNTKLGQSEWGSEFSKRINFMISGDIKQAELRLDPPDLGRINIKITVNQDQANVVFSSAHGNVREAIENSLPRLRELLQESGIQLNDANINEGQKENSNNDEDNGQLAGPVLPEMEGEETATGDQNQAKLQHSVDGLIDYFA